MLFVAFSPEQSYACGAGCKKETTPTAHPLKKEQSCCAEKEKPQDCCEKTTKDQNSGGHHCGGKCGGKCGSNCGCTVIHFAAITTEELDFLLFQPDFTHPGFPYTTPLVSKGNLDIWLPPDIRA